MARRREQEQFGDNPLFKSETLDDEYGNYSEKAAVDSSPTTRTTRTTHNESSDQHELAADSIAQVASASAANDVNAQQQQQRQQQQKRGSNLVIATTKSPSSSTSPAHRYNHHHHRDPHPQRQQHQIRGAASGLEPASTTASFQTSQQQEQKQQHQQESDDKNNKPSAISEQEQNDNLMNSDNDDDVDDQNGNDDDHHGVQHQIKQQGDTNSVNHKTTAAKDNHNNHRSNISDHMSHDSEGSSKKTQPTHNYTVSVAVSSSSTSSFPDISNSNNSGNHNHNNNNNNNNDHQHQLQQQQQQITHTFDNDGLVGRVDFPAGYNDNNNNNSNIGNKLRNEVKNFLTTYTDEEQEKTKTSQVMRMVLIMDDTDSDDNDDDGDDGIDVRQEAERTGAVKKNRKANETCEERIRKQLAQLGKVVDTRVMPLVILEALLKQLFSPSVSLASTTNEHQKRPHDEQQQGKHEPITSASKTTTNDNSKNSNTAEHSYANYSKINPSGYLVPIRRPLPLQFFVARRSNIVNRSRETNNINNQKQQSTGQTRCNDDDDDNNNDDNSNDGDEQSQRFSRRRGNDYYQSILRQRPDLAHVLTEKVKSHFFRHGLIVADDFSCVSLADAIILSKMKWMEWNVYNSCGRGAGSSSSPTSFSSSSTLFAVNLTKYFAGAGCLHLPVGGLLKDFAAVHPAITLGKARLETEQLGYLMDQKEKFVFGVESFEKHYGQRESRIVSRHKRIRPSLYSSQRLNADLFASLAEQQKFLEEPTFRGIVHQIPAMAVQNIIDYNDLDRTALDNEDDDAAADNYNDLVSPYSKNEKRTTAAKATQAPAATTAPAPTIKTTKAKISPTSSPQQESYFFSRSVTDVRLPNRFGWGNGCADWILRIHAVEVGKTSIFVGLHQEDARSKVAALLNVGRRNRPVSSFYGSLPSSSSSPSRHQQQQQQQQHKNGDESHSHQRCFCFESENDIPICGCPYHPMIISVFKVVVPLVAAVVVGRDGDGHDGEGNDGVASRSDLKNIQQLQSRNQTATIQQSSTNQFSAERDLYLRVDIEKTEAERDADVYYLVVPRLQLVHEHVYTRTFKRRRDSESHDYNNNNDTNTDNRHDHDHRQQQCPATRTTAEQAAHKRLQPQEQPHQPRQQQQQRQKKTTTTNEKNKSATLPSTMKANRATKNASASTNSRENKESPRFGKIWLDPLVEIFDSPSFRATRKTYSVLHPDEQHEHPSCLIHKEQVVISTEAKQVDFVFSLSVPKTCGLKIDGSSSSSSRNNTNNNNNNNNIIVNYQTFDQVQSRRRKEQKLLNNSNKGNDGDSHDLARGQKSDPLGQDRGSRSQIGSSEDGPSQRQQGIESRDDDNNNNTSNRDDDFFYRPTNTHKSLSGSLVAPSRDFQRLVSEQCRGAVKSISELCEEMWKRKRTATPMMTRRKGEDEENNNINDDDDDDFNHDNGDDGAIKNDEAKFSTPSLPSHQQINSFLYQSRFSFVDIPFLVLRDQILTVLDSGAAKATTTNSTSSSCSCSSFDLVSHVRRRYCGVDGSRSNDDSDNDDDAESSDDNTTHYFVRDLCRDTPGAKDFRDSDRQGKVPYAQVDGKVKMF